MTGAPSDDTANPRPVWLPIWLACRSCKHEWDDWQPNVVPLQTWIAHVKTYQCPQCGAGASRIVLRRKTPEAGIV